MPSPPKSGPLTYDDLKALWTGLVDPLYAQPFLADEANSGFEAWGQLFQQLARASQAVDTTTQALYISPNSGQSDDPASGAQNATVFLAFQRTKLIDKLLYIGTEVPILEVSQDAGPDGPVPVLTGRRYFLDEPVILKPGDPGGLVTTAQAEDPFHAHAPTYQATAERPGYGFNNPQPYSISELQQDGGDLSNDRASVSNNTLLARNVPDVPIPAHVGQYFTITAGVNAGEIRRVAGYGPPDVGGGIGGSFVPDPIAVTEGSIIGAFEVGESVTLAGASQTYAVGIVLGAFFGGRVAWRALSGDAVSTFADASVMLTGASSGAVQTPTAVLQKARLADASASEAWEMLDWVDDWGLTVSNALSPEGGRLGMLDAIGKERKIFRAPNETDDAYRVRVGQIADTVSPGAVLRAINRVLAPYGLSACFREVGTLLLPGLYFDLDAFDYDFTARPGDRFRLMLSYGDFRAFFLVGVPPLNWGEFGCAWDAGPNNAWDGPVAWDGYPVGARALYKNVWQAVENARAAGVGFELYIERLGCN